MPALLLPIAAVIGSGVSFVAGIFKGADIAKPSAAVNQSMGGVGSASLLTIFGWVFLVFILWRVGFFDFLKAIFGGKRRAK